MNKNLKIVMMGATGAVGGQAVEQLRKMTEISSLTLLGRRKVEAWEGGKIDQHSIDIHEPDSYSNLLPGHQIAICTLGVGEPSKISKEDFLKIDKEAVYKFAEACKNAGIKHFELLASVGISENSSSFYLRSKGELVAAIDALKFERFSVFQPSMILTPTNRYGLLQGITLKVWPMLTPLLFGKGRKYRGIPVDVLGKSMAMNVLRPHSGTEYLEWDDFYAITEVSQRNP